jgi:DNA integrity scanning protein DisA with diadenylate cyclase activity
MEGVTVRTNVAAASSAELYVCAVPDGAVIIDDTGQVRCIGMRLCPPATAKKIRLRSHKGTRHRSVAETTAISRAIGIVVSATDGVLTIFADGQACLEW